MIKIKAIMPDKAMERNVLDLREKMLANALANDTTISVDCIKKGPDELDCNTDEVFAASEIVKKGIEAACDGFDAIVIYCFSDVGVDALRENVSIPVIGPGETTLAIAGTFCNRFAVLTTESKNIPRTYRRLMKNCIAREKMTSVRALDIPAVELRTNPSATQKYIESVCEDALRNDGIDGVILGCLGMAQYGLSVEKKFKIRVFDPAFISVAAAEMCARLGIRHSEISYPKFINISNIEL